MLLLHKPARRIGADGQRRHVERPQPLTDLRQPFRIAAVAGKIKPQRRMVDHPAAPQRAIAIPQRAHAPVPRWRGVDRQLAQRQTLPPVQLMHLQPITAEPALQAERHDELGLRETPRQLPHRAPVKVIIMVMGDQHRIHRRQLLHRQRRRRSALRAVKAQRRCAFGQRRIDQDIAPAQPQQHRGMPQPPDAVATAAEIGRLPPAFGKLRVALLRRLGQPLALALILPTLKIPLLTPRRFRVAKSLRRVMRLGRVVITVDSFHPASSPNPQRPARA
ncbi:Uncharacterised protein [Acinetobacter baumannii]|nr:Uncharacterised protein [Acinetobacter baumannii]